MQTRNSRLSVDDERPHDVAAHARPRVGETRKPPWARATARAGLVVGALLAVSGCGPAVGANERLLVEGRLEREGIDGTNDAEVSIDYLSDESRGEWWPCDLRMTAQGCVDDRHVNVYVSLPSVTALEGLAGATCVVDGRPQGVFELIDDNVSDEIDVGSEVSVFVLVASETVAPSGANLADDEETHAASRLSSGTLSIFEKGDVDADLHIRIEGRTVGGRDVNVEFHGPMSSPGTIPPLEGPSTCVNRALVDGDDDSG